MNQNPSDVQSRCTPLSRLRIASRLLLPGVFVAGSLLTILPGTTTAHGQMSWHWISLPDDETIRNQIEASMDQTVTDWNTWADHDYSIPVIYDEDTPTAAAGYRWRIRFGGSRGYTIAMHEASHWLGTGTVSQWEPFLRFGRWTGTYAFNLRAAYDGPGERMGGDKWHYWPYGANFAAEGVNAPKMVGIIGAFRRDMDLADGDRTIGIAPGTYRLRHRQTIKMLDSTGTDSSGDPVRQNENALGTGQQWEIARVPDTPYFTFTNVETGLLLDSMGATDNGAAVGLRPLGRRILDSMLWEIQATDSFFFRIVNKANGKALDNLGRTSDGSGVGQWTPNPSWNQHWTFVHPLVQFAPEAGVISQGRRSSASSSDMDHGHWKGNNGVAGDRWTATDGSYPQWWQVDLGSVQPITKVETDWASGGGRSYRYRIEVSDDGENFTVAADRTNNTTSGTTIDSIDANGRFVRVVITGATNGRASIHECRVYNETQPLKLLSQHRPATASSENRGHLAVNATNVDATFTRWAAANGDFPQWWQVDLGSVQEVRKAVIEWTGDGQRSYRYRIEGSDDGVDFATLIDRTDNTNPGVTTDHFSGSARYLRVTVTGTSHGWASFHDAQIYGVAPTLTPSETWRLTHFGSLEETEETADDADPDGNGIPNLLEYALGSNPLVADDGKQPRVSREDGRLTIRFQRNTAATDLILSVVAANELDGEWTEIARSAGGNPFVATVEGAIVNEDATTEVRPVQVTDIELITDSGNPKRFMRLDATRIKE